MLKLLFIAAGGVAGALARYTISELVQSQFRIVFPYGTLIVNLLGSLLIGLLWGVFEEITISVLWRSFLMIGFLGALTTFSTFTLETFNLLRENEVLLAFLNILANNIFGLMFVFAGYYLSGFFIKLI